MDRWKPATFYRSCSNLDCQIFLQGTHKDCGRCQDEAYCSEACQKACWPVHKNDCKFVNDLKPFFSPRHITARREFDALAGFIGNEVMAAARSALLLNNPKKTLANSHYLSILFDYLPAPDNSSADINDPSAIRQKFAFREAYTSPFCDVKEDDRRLGLASKVLGTAHHSSVYDKFTKVAKTQQKGDQPVIRLFLRYVAPEDRHWTRSQYHGLNGVACLLPGTVEMLVYDHMSGVAPMEEVPENWDKVLKCSFDHYKDDVAAGLRTPEENQTTLPYFRLVLREAALSLPEVEFRKLMWAYSMSIESIRWKKEMDKEKKESGKEEKERKFGMRPIVKVC